MKLPVVTAGTTGYPVQLYDLDAIGCILSYNCMSIMQSIPLACLLSPVQKIDFIGARVERYRYPGTGTGMHMHMRHTTALLSLRSNINYFSEIYCCFIAGGGSTSAATKCISGA